jgi:hypothetical protein
MNSSSVAHGLVHVRYQAATALPLDVKAQSYNRFLDLFKQAKGKRRRKNLEVAIWCAEGATF